MVPFISNIIMLVVQMDPSSLNFFCNPPFSFSPFSNSPDFKVSSVFMLNAKRRYSIGNRMIAVYHRVKLRTN